MFSQSCRLEMGTPPGCGCLLRVYMKTKRCPFNASPFGGRWILDSQSISPTELLFLTGNPPSSLLFGSPALRFLQPAIVSLSSVSLGKAPCLQEIRGRREEGSVVGLRRDGTILLLYSWQFLTVSLLRSRERTRRVSSSARPEYHRKLVLLLPTEDTDSGNRTEGWRMPGSDVRSRGSVGLPAPRLRASRLSNSLKRPP